MNYIVSTCNRLLIGPAMACDARHHAEGNQSSLPTLTLGHCFEVGSWVPGLNDIFSYRWEEPDSDGGPQGQIVGLIRSQPQGAQASAWAEAQEAARSSLGASAANPGVRSPFKG
jgi:hypothetical protein